MKNYKTPGVDGISNEQLKYGSSGMVDYLVTLFGKVWDDEKIPEDWSKSQRESSLHWVRRGMYLTVLTIVG